MYSVFEFVWVIDLFLVCIDFFEGNYEVELGFGWYMGYLSLRKFVYFLMIFCSFFDDVMLSVIVLIWVCFFGNLVVEVCILRRLLLLILIVRVVNFELGLLSRFFGVVFRNFLIIW